MQNYLSETVPDEQACLPDDVWAILDKLLPPERGRHCRPAQSNRLYFEGMLWVARTGAPWRHLPAEYGKWNSVFRRYRRWVLARVFQTMLEKLDAMVAQDTATGKANSAAIMAYLHVICIERDLTKPSLWTDSNLSSALMPWSMAQH